MTKHEDIDHSGLTGIPSGALATDSLWDAAGDLVQGTGANTAAKLTLGAAGTVVRSTGSTNAYAYPPGYELDYVQITTGVNVTGTSEGAANTIITGTSQAYAASPIIIEVFSPRVQTSTTDASSIVILLYDGGTILGRLGLIKTINAETQIVPFLGRYRLTPTADTHQYIVKALSTAGTDGSVQAGAGGSATELPAYVRVTVA